MAMSVDVQIVTEFAIDYQCAGAERFRCRVVFNTLGSIEAWSPVPIA